MSRLSGANARRISARLTTSTAQTPATTVAASRSVMGELTVAGVSSKITPAVVTTIALTLKTFQNSEMLCQRRMPSSSRRPPPHTAGATPLSGDWGLTPIAGGTGSAQS